MILPPSVGELILDVVQILLKHIGKDHCSTLNSETGTQENLNAGVMGDRTSDPTTAPESPDGRTHSSRRSSFGVEDGLPCSLVALSDLKV